MKDPSISGMRAAPRGPLWLSAPIAILGLVSSAAGVFTAFPYAAETATWAAQGKGQDAVNLAVFTMLVAAAIIAARRSLAAYLVWLGLVLYSAYSYLIYAGFLHFGPLFPVYIATFGVSVYTLAWGLLSIDLQGLPQLFGGFPRHATAGFMLLVAALFYALDLSIDLGAILRGTVPEGIVETGLVVDPVHLLDMGLLLPAMIVTGISLLRDRPLGYLLAPPLLTFLGTLTIAIGAMFIAMAASGIPIAWPMVGIFALSAIVSFVLLGRMLVALRHGGSMAGVTRSAGAPADPSLSG